VEEDEQLLLMIDILEELIPVADVRPILRKKYQIEELLKETNMI